MSGSPPAFPRRIEKPWGHEEILVETEFYRLRVLAIRAGEGISLQRHTRKHESWYVDGGAGEATLGFYTEGGSLGASTFPVFKGQSLTVPPGTVHRLGALPDRGLRVIEVSNAVPDTDIERIHDPYADRRGP